MIVRCRECGRELKDSYFRPAVNYLNAEDRQGALL